MDYEPKVIPEGINTSQEHPVREFLILTGGIGFLVAVIIFILVLASDYLVGYISIEKENQWFSYGEHDKSSDSKNSEVSDNKKREVEKYLLSIVNQLKDKNHQQFRFTVNLLDEKTPNAFIMPGGHIVVTTGLLSTVTSENALAMVIGHEMGHQYKRHTIKGMGRGIVITMGLMILTGFDDSDLIQGFVGNTAAITSLVFSREQEREADEIGVKLLLQHYRHATGATEFFRKIEVRPDSQSGTPVFMSTHPGAEERIKYLEKYELEYQGQVKPLPDFIADYKVNNE